MKQEASGQQEQLLPGLPSALTVPAPNSQPSRMKRKLNEVEEAAGVGTIDKDTAGVPQPQHEHPAMQQQRRGDDASLMSNAPQADEFTVSEGADRDTPTYVFTSEDRGSSFNNARQGAKAAGQPGSAQRNSSSGGSPFLAVDAGGGGAGAAGAAAGAAGAAAAKTGPVSNFHGVTWYKASKRWQARLCTGRKQFHLGYFKTEEDAARAYDRAVLQHKGVSGNIQLNFPSQIDRYRAEIQANEAERAGQGGAGPNWSQQLGAGAAAGRAGAGAGPKGPASWGAGTQAAGAAGAAPAWQPQPQQQPGLETQLQSMQQQQQLVQVFDAGSNSIVQTVPMASVSQLQAGSIVVVNGQAFQVQHVPATQAQNFLPQPQPVQQQWQMQAAPQTMAQQWQMQQQAPQLLQQPWPVQQMAQQVVQQPAQQAQQVLATAPGITTAMSLDGNTSNDLSRMRSSNSAVGSGSAVQAVEGPPSTSNISSGMAAPQLPQAAQQQAMANDMFPLDRVSTHMLSQQPDGSALMQGHASSMGSSSGSMQQAITLALQGNTSTALAGGGTTQVLTTPTPVAGAQASAPGMPVQQQQQQLMQPGAQVVPGIAPVAQAPTVVLQQDQQQQQQQLAAVTGMEPMSYAWDGTQFVMVPQSQLQTFMVQHALMAQQQQLQTSVQVQQQPAAMGYLPGGTMLQMAPGVMQAGGMAGMQPVLMPGMATPQQLMAAGPYVAAAQAPTLSLQPQPMQQQFMIQHPHMPQQQQFMFQPQPQQQALLQGTVATSGSGQQAMKAEAE